MSYQDIEWEQDGHIAIIRLNRPEVMNAFSGRMGEEWSDAYRRCDENDSIRAVVITGAGSAFCAGADMSTGAQTFASFEGDKFSAGALTTPAFAVRKPVIAAVNGHAIGLGLSLAIQADLRIFALEGKYGFLQVRRGVIADAYIHWTLPRLIGAERASELLLTGKRISGEEALRLGLAGHCLPSAEVLPAALRMAYDIAENASPLAVALTKQLLWRSHHSTLAEIGALETAWLAHTMGTPDAIEGGAAYVERRPPQWSSSVRYDWPRDSEGVVE